MNEFLASNASDITVEEQLREELAHGDALIGTIAPILRHLIANDEHSVFSDEIIASVRGMMYDVARQLLDSATSPAGQAEPRQHPAEFLDFLVSGFVVHKGFLAHIHALALEWQLTERLQARIGVDPVLTPLLQALIASSEASVSANAMALLAAQARFVQHQRRIQLPLGELPGDLLYAALQCFQKLAETDEGRSLDFAAAESSIRASYDEGRSRLGLISRAVTGMGGGAGAALSVTHAGVGIFLSAMAMAAGQTRDMAVLSTNEGQLARLALVLRAAGLKPQAVEEQFLSLHPDISLPAGFEQIGPDRAAAMLAVSAAYPAA